MKQNKQKIKEKDKIKGLEIWEGICIKCTWKLLEKIMKTPKGKKILSTLVIPTKRCKICGGIVK